MDYVVAGLAVGAGLAILGFLLREAGLSRRFSLPLWFADAGLALMSSAVVTWLLTFTAIATEQDDTEATTIIVAGSLVALIAAFVLVLHSGSRRRSIMRIHASLPQQQLLLRSEPVEFPEVSTTTTAAPAEPAPEVQSRSQEDWEEIWQKTWGSGELPQAAQRTVDDEPAVEAASGSTWETWSAEENAKAEPADPEEVPTPAESAQENQPDADEPTTESPNGSQRVPEPIDQHE